MKCPPCGVACFMVKKECCNHACVEVLNYTSRHVHSRRESTSPGITSPLWTTFFRRFGLQREAVWPNVPATQQKGSAKS